MDLMLVVLSKDEDERLESPLRKLLEFLPSTSDEYKGAGTGNGSHVSVSGTTFATYVSLFQKLCQLLQSSGSKSIFTSLIHVYCRCEYSAKS